MKLVTNSQFNIFLKSYAEMNIGGKVIGCPYWSNKMENGQVAVRGFLNGKGEAEEIRKQLERIYEEELKKGIITESADDLIKLAKRNRIGIDCSGLVYRLLSFLVTNGYYSQKENLAVESFFPEGINKTNADALTGKNHCRKIEKAEDLLPGDLVRMMEGKHVLFVLDCKEKEVIYVHSSEKSRQKGVHLGKFFITKVNGKEQLEWKEETSDGNNFGLKYFHIEQGDGFFRSKIFIQ